MIIEESEASVVGQRMGAYGFSAPVQIPKFPRAKIKLYGDVSDIYGINTRDWAKPENHCLSVPVGSQATRFKSIFFSGKA